MVPPVGGSEARRAWAMAQMANIEHSFLYVPILRDAADLPIPEGGRDRALDLLGAGMYGKIVNELRERRLANVIHTSLDWTPDSTYGGYVPAEQQEAFFNSLVGTDFKRSDGVVIPAKNTFAGNVSAIVLRTYRRGHLIQEGSSTPYVAIESRPHTPVLAIEPQRTQSSSYMPAGEDGPIIVRRGTTRGNDILSPSQITVHSSHDTPTQDVLRIGGAPVVEERSVFASRQGMTETPSDLRAIRQAATPLGAPVVRPLSIAQQALAQRDIEEGAYRRRIAAEKAAHEASIAEANRVREADTIAERLRARNLAEANEILSVQRAAANKRLSEAEAARLVHLRLFADGEAAREAMVRGHRERAFRERAMGDSPVPRESILRENSVVDASLTRSPSIGHREMTPGGGNVGILRAISATRTPDAHVNVSASVAMAAVVAEVSRPIVLPETRVAARVEAAAADRVVETISSSGSETNDDEPSTPARVEPISVAPPTRLGRAATADGTSYGAFWVKRNRFGRLMTGGEMKPNALFQPRLKRSEGPLIDSSDESEDSGEDYV
jgi:hypothetical protein